MRLDIFPTWKSTGSFSECKARNVVSKPNLNIFIVTVSRELLLDIFHSQLQLGISGEQAEDLTRFFLLVSFCTQPTYLSVIIALIHPSNSTVEQNVATTKCRESDI